MEYESPHHSHRPSGASMLRGLNARMARIHPAGVPPNAGAAVLDSSDSEGEVLSVVGRGNKAPRRRRSSNSSAGYQPMHNDGAGGGGGGGDFGPAGSPQEPAWRAKFNNRRAPNGVAPGVASPTKLPFRQSPQRSPAVHPETFMP